MLAFKDMKSHSNNYDVIVIGGGASGMIAAGRAAALGKQVLLLEKNKSLGAKLKISGGGRCNITNANYDPQSLLKNYGKAAPFLFSPFAEFGVKDTFAFFEKQKLPLMVEANNRAFPETRKATDVVKALIGYLQTGGVEVRTEQTVEKILHAKNSITGIVANGQAYTAANYILATGGNSHPETGSTGDGFKWLAGLGHTVVKPTPSIVPLKTGDKWSHLLAGTTLSDMKITFLVNGQKKFKEEGRILFTHVGLSGPLILNAAGKVADLLHEGDVTALIDMYPKLDIGSLDKRLLGIFELHKNKSLKNVLKELTGGSFVGGLSLLLPSLDLDMKVNSVTKEERRLIVDTLKNLPITITGLLGLDKAVVADGGVKLSEIETKTMRSKIINNLSVTGDLLHINRPSGGFSLQLCWTTGWVAGNYA